MCEFISGLWFDSINQPVCLCTNTVQSFVFYHNCFVVQLEIRDGGYFIVQYCFTCPGFFLFPYKLRIAISRSVKKNCVEIDENCIWICRLLLVRWSFYYVTILPIHENGDFSTVWYVQFLSSETLSSFSTGLSLTWLELHKDSLY